MYTKNNTSVNIGRRTLVVDFLFFVEKKDKKPLNYRDRPCSNYHSTTPRRVQVKEKKDIKRGGN